MELGSIRGVEPGTPLFLFLESYRGNGQSVTSHRVSEQKHLKVLQYNSSFLVLPESPLLGVGAPLCLSAGTSLAGLCTLSSQASATAALCSQWKLPP